MAERTWEREIVGDWLSPVTRRQRRYLLVATLLVMMVKTGIFPEKVPALGIDFGEKNAGAFALIMVSAMCYFLLSFAIYAAGDWYVRKARLEQIELGMPPPSGTRFLRFIAWSRVTFDFWIPLLMGIGQFSYRGN